MITPEKPGEMIEKMARAYWNIAPKADYDAHASKPVEEVKAGVRDNLSVALAAVYPAITKQILTPFEALFAGGPDTACRTTWPEGVECVEVPMADLRAAFDAVRSLAGKETP